jgi:hypothetical protein
MSFIPAFFRQRVVDENGYFTPEMHQFFDVFFQQASNNLSNEGIEIPSLTADQIKNINSPLNPNRKPPGTTYYNADNHLLQANINGTVKTIVTS